MRFPDDYRAAARIAVELVDRGCSWPLAVRIALLDGDPITPRDHLEVYDAALVNAR